MIFKFSLVIAAIALSAMSLVASRAMAVQPLDDDTHMSCKVLLLGPLEDKKVEFLMLLASPWGLSPELPTERVLRGSLNIQDRNVEFLNLRPEGEELAPNVEKQLKFFLTKDDELQIVFVGSNILDLSKYMASIQKLRTLLIQLRQQELLGGHEFTFLLTDTSSREIFRAHLLFGNTFTVSSTFDRLLSSSDIMRLPNNAINVHRNSQPPGDWELFRTRTEAIFSLQNRFLCRFFYLPTVNHEISERQRLSELIQLQNWEVIRQELQNSHSNPFILHRWSPDNHQLITTMPEHQSIRSFLLSLYRNRVWGLKLKIPKFLTFLMIRFFMQ